MDWSLDNIRKFLLASFVVALLLLYSITICQFLKFKFYSNVIMFICLCIVYTCVYGELQDRFIVTDTVWPKTFTICSHRK